jgi:hypothetical protein
LFAQDATVVGTVTFGLEGFLDRSARATESMGWKLQTFRKRNPVLIPTRNRTLQTILGSANGNLIKNLLFLNKLGKFSAGFAKKPPKEGPKIEPRLHTSGIIENALG